MSKDLQIIRQLEKGIGFELTQVDHDEIMKHGTRRYTLDSDNKVRGLALFNAQISDISVLGGLKNLTWLNLSSNQIFDISVLGGLEHLTDLYLSSNRTADISVLRELKNL